MLVLMVLPVLVGGVFGWARGGRPGELGELPLTMTWLLWLAVATQLVQFRFRGGAAMLALVFSFVGVWLVANVVAVPSIRASLAVIGLGLVLNLAPILANDGRMPFLPTAAIQAGISPGDFEAPRHLVKNIPAGNDTRLVWLGDLLPLRPIRKVVSVGDVVIMVGVSLLVARGMQPMASEQHDSAAIDGSGAQNDE